MELRKIKFKEPNDDFNRIKKERVEKFKELKGDNAIVRLKVANSKKGHVSLECSDYEWILKDKDYATHLQEAGGLLIGLQTDIEENENYIFYSVIIPYPWYADREDLPNPDKEQEIPSLKMKSAEESDEIIRIVGLQHYATDEDMERLRKLADKRGKVTFRAEPNNEYDSNAIAVYLPEGKKVGYVTKEGALLINPLLKTRKEIKAELEYVDFFQKYAESRIFYECSESLKWKKLLKRYSVSEIYKAFYMHRCWNFAWTEQDQKLFAANEMHINFDYLLSLSIDWQDSLAERYEEMLTKITVPNPTNPNFDMTVPLDLSVYGTSWKKLDLIKDDALLEVIRIESNIVALFIRARRMAPYINSIEDYEEALNTSVDSKTLRIRMQKLLESNYR